jgi:hypothetical protein
MANSLLDQDSACLLKIQQYAMQQMPALTTEQKKTVCNRINQNALNDFLDPILGEMRATNEVEILKNKILNGFPDSSRLEIAMGVIAMALPTPSRASKPIAILASEVEIDALIQIGKGSSATVYKFGSDHVIKTLRWGEQEAKMMAESINYLAQHVSAITPVTHAGGDRLLQQHIKGVTFDELPAALKKEATILLREAISGAYTKVHNLQSRGIHAEIDSETHNFIIQHSADKITGFHWIDPVGGVLEHSPAR